MLMRNLLRSIIEASKENVVHFLRHNARQTSEPRRWLQTGRLHMAPKVETLVKRPPVVTIMGHVDHGKTTLLDHLRNSEIVKQEFGGITQHIGAFVVPFKMNKTTELVTFLDTPGHAAFASMRQRGANVTDIVVLVIACEDGVSEQTVESIKYANNSKVPIIVAVNKIDKFPNQNELDKNVKLVRDQLVVHDIITELDGGDVQLVKISALEGIGIEELKESILALAETLALKADYNPPVRGTVIESLVHPHRGKLCTILVSQGILKKGQYLVAGEHNWAKVRALFDERGQTQQDCGPGLPIQVIGWREDQIPAAGDPIVQVHSEADAKSIINTFKQEQLLEKSKHDLEAYNVRAARHRELYTQKFQEKLASGRKYGRIFLTERGRRPKESEEDVYKDRKLNLILKCDVDGSLDAILDILDTYDKRGNQPVRLELMHYGVGPITDGDYSLATSFKNSVIYGFNVKLADQKILTRAKHDGVDVKLFNVIYHMIDDLKARIQEKIPEYELDHELGRALVMQEFVVKESSRFKRVHVAGCRCSSGSLNKKSLFKLIRNNDFGAPIVSEMRVRTLKHLKDDVNEVTKENECGISFLDHESLEFKQGDVIIAYERRKHRPKLKWDLKGFS